MAAPSVTARVTPTGFKMPDGYQSTIAFANQPNIQFWEMTVKPPAIEGGDAIKTTTMHNARWRTSDAKKLVELGEVTGSAMYDPDVIGATDNAGLRSLINANQAITIHFPDLSTLAFFGFLGKVEFGELKEGEPPTLTYTIHPTCWDPVNFVEAGPVFTAASGT